MLHPFTLSDDRKVWRCSFRPKNPYQLHVKSSNSEDVISIPLGMTFFSHRLNKSRSFSNTSPFLLSVSKSTSRLGCLVVSPTGLRLYATSTLYTDMEFLYLDWYREWFCSSDNFVNGRFSSRDLLRGLAMLKGNFLKWYKHQLDATIMVY